MVWQSYGWGRLAFGIPNESAIDFWRPVGEGGCCVGGRVTSQAY